MTKYSILPSILSANMMHLGSEIAEVIKAGADMIHFDVMDNHYVPNLTLGPLVCQSLRNEFTGIPIDVHLMTKPVDPLIVKFAEAGANRISIHPDTSLHLDRSLSLIKECGCEVGLVLNPSTSLDCLTYTIRKLDFVLVMTVNPGFGGQKLIPDIIRKISDIHQLYPELTIAVDGGVSKENIAELAFAGATEFIAGSSIFNSNNYKESISTLRQVLKDK